MNFRWMEIYLSVIDTGSSAAAARKQYMTQPAVSIAVSSLEKEVKQTLLYRKAGQRTCIQPTPEGKIFAEYARRTLDEYWKVRDFLSIRADEKPLIIGTSPTPASSIVPILVSSFRNGRPKCSIQVRAFRGKELIQELKKGTVDCAITGISSFVLDEKYVVEPFFNDPMVLISSKTFHDGNPITVNQLKKLPLIIRGMDCNTTELIIQQLKKLDLTLEDLNVTLQVIGNSDVIQQVREGYGVGFVVRSSLENGSDSDKINIIPVKRLEINREIRLVYPRASEDFQTLQSFVQYARGGNWRTQKFSFNTIL